MANCGKCASVVASSDGIQCYKCDIELHKECVDWENTADCKIIVCDKCKVNNELPIEYCPEEASTSQVQNTTVASNSGLDRDLICILFPGIVKNSEKAIQCLGGIKGISQVQSQPQKKRLGLSFQPENPFVKRMFSDYRKTAGVLLKVRVKKVRIDGEVQRKVMSTNVVGRVSSIHRFDSLCDFQYLPVYREAPGQPQQCIIDQIIPVGGDDINFMKGESPLFMIPAHFTRFDRPINYTYTDKRYPDRSGTPDGEDEFHNKSRSDRGRPLGHWWWFSLNGEFPTKPDDCYIRNRDNRYEYNPLLKKEFELVKKSFDERPIWSLNRLRYELKLRITSLKILIPCVAVFAKDGPWKSLWVRFGFDPRQEPSARMYQTLDFRLRHQAGVYTMVMTREQVVHYKSADRVRSRHAARRLRAPPPHEDVSEGAVIYRPGMVPAQRQIFYQLCDVHLPEVERLVRAAPAGACHEKLGWLPPPAADTCRDLIFRSVKQTLLASHSADLKFDVAEDGSSEEDSRSSGDDITNEMDESM